MTNVSFYKLGGNQEMMFTLVCTLIKKAYSQNKQVLCLIPDDITPSEISSRLWKFENDSFIPHDIGAESTPIAISNGPLPGSHDEILLNLQSVIPPWFSQFDRVIEIIYQDLNNEQAKRKNFRFYKDRGYPLKFHDLTDSFTG
jgi:DNA polymerase-3 subunit chi